MSKEITAPSFWEAYTDTCKSRLGEEVQEKNGYNYLSWAYALKHLKISYPEARVRVYKYPDPNGNLIVPYLRTKNGTYVTVRLYLDRLDLKEDIYEEFTHPVLDYRNKPILEPTSFQINTSIQRATAKVIAIGTGIGLSLYANEDLPPEIEPEQPRYLNKGITVNEPKQVTDTKQNVVSEKVQTPADKEELPDKKRTERYFASIQTEEELKSARRKATESYPRLAKQPGKPPIFWFEVAYDNARDRIFKAKQEQKKVLSEADNIPV